MNVVNQYGEKRNGFAEVAAFCHVTCRYFDRFLLQGVDINWCQACFLNQARAAPGFLKLILYANVCMFACVCVCVRPRGY